MSDILKLDISLDAKNLELEVHKLLAVIRPEWKEGIKVKRTSGGYINTGVCVSVPEQPDDKILVRVNGTSFDDFINRDKELHYMKELSQAGIAQPILCTFKNGLVVHYVNGEAFTGQMKMDPHIGMLAAQAIACLHNAEITPHKDSVVISEEKYNSFMQQLEDGIKKYWRDDMEGCCIPDRNKALQLFEDLKVLCKELFDNTKLVPCHNDLVMGNLIYDKEKDAVYIIDWEVMDLGPPEIDLGSFFLRWFDYAPKKADRTFILKHYLEAKHKRPFSMDDVLEYDNRVIKGCLLYTMFTLIWAFTEMAKETCDMEMYNGICKDLIESYSDYLAEIKEKH